MPGKGTLAMWVFFFAAKKDVCYFEMKKVTREVLLCLGCTSPTAGAGVIEGQDFAFGESLSFPSVRVDVWREFVPPADPRVVRRMGRMFLSLSLSQNHTACLLSRKRGSILSSPPINLYP